MEEELEESQDCLLCKVFAGFGILLGIVFVAMSVDLLTNGRLSGLVGRKVDDE